MRINMRFEGKWLLLLVVALAIQENVVSASLETDIASANKDIKDIIIPEISSIINLFDGILVPDVAPSAVTEPVTYCYEPEDELQEIQNVFTSSIASDRIGSITMVKSSKCSQIVKMKSAILKLKLDLYQLRKYIPTVKYDNEKVNYVSRMEEVMGEMETVYKTESGSTKVAKLRQDLTALQTDLNAVLDRLEDKKQELTDKTFRLVVDKLKANQIADAVENYRGIAHKDKINDIITSAYENVNSFKVLFKFIQIQEESTKNRMSVLKGFVALSDKITAQGHVNIENLIIFINGVSKYEGPEFEDLTKTLYNKLRSANYDQFYESYRQIDPKHYYEAFHFDVKVLMQILVRGTLNNDTNNVEKVLDMKSKFQSIEDRLEILTALMREMVNSKHLINSPEMMILIYDVMEIRQEVDAQYNVHNKQTVNELYNSVPDALKSLMYNNLCMRNIMNGDYVYSAEKPLDAERRALYATKRIELTTPNDPSFVFQAQFIHRGRKLLFKNRHGEHLYFMAGNSPRKLVSWMQGSLETDSKAYFMVERIDEMAVRVRSVEFEENVYAESGDGDTKGVYAAKGVDALWSLETCPFHYNI